jgi:hypothetical protein
MKKTWTINNGWNRVNMCGQMVLCQIGPSDFDPNYEENAIALAQGYGKLPYRSNGTSYTFSRKRDFDAAVAQLRAKGYIA